MTNQLPPSLEEFLATLQGTQLEDVFNDEATADRAFIDTLQASVDPVAQEIGAGLADDSMSVSDVVHGSSYQDFLSNGFAWLYHVDVAGTLAAAAPSEPAPQAPVAHEDDDPDEVWRNARDVW